MEPNTQVEKAAEQLVPFLSKTFASKADVDAAAKSSTEHVDAVKKDILAAIEAKAPAAPAIVTRDRKWVVRSQFTGQEKEFQYSFGKTLHVLNSLKQSGGYPNEKQFGAEVEYVKKAISDGSSTAGGSLIPQEWSDFIIPELGAQVVVLKAGANVLPMQHQVMNIPGIATTQSVAWVGENTAITESDPTTNNTPLTLHTAKFLTGLSKEWLDDATPETDAALQASFVRSAVRFVDGALLNGTGTTQPLGLANVTGITQLFAGAGAANGSLPTYDDFNAAIEAMDEADVPQAKRCWFMRPRTLAEVRGLKDTLGRPLFFDNLQQGALLLASGAITSLSNGPDGFIMGYPVYTTTNVPKNLVRGTSGAVCSYVLLVAMSDVYVGQGIRSAGLEIAMSDQAFFVNAEIAVRGLYRIDIQPGHALSIVNIGGVL